MAAALTYDAGVAVVQRRVVDDSRFAPGLALIIAADQLGLAVRTDVLSVA